MLASKDFHKEFSSLVVPLNDIGVNGYDYKGLLSAEALSALIQEPHDQMFSYSSQTESALAFFIERENDHCFKVNIQTTLHLTGSCVRCLKPLTHEISLDFWVRMLDGVHLGVQEEQEKLGFLDEHDFDMNSDADTVGYFYQRCIDVGLILREQIFLEAPDYPQCSHTNCETLLRGIMGALGKDEKYPYNNPFAKLLKKS